MFTGMEFMSCPNLAVPAEVMQHVARVESGFNPFAIGVVGGQLQRQPHNLSEALATVRMLESRGYNFSVGLAQVNRANLGRYGLDSYEKAFSACANLTAGADILARCHASAGGDWGKAFSCYYSGNFVSGYRDGYVRKIYSSINGTSAPRVDAIPLQLVTSPTRAQSVMRTPAPAHNAAYRVSIRSVALDSVAAGDVGGAPAQAVPAPTPLTQSAGKGSEAPAASVGPPGHPTTRVDTAPFVAKVIAPGVRNPAGASTGAAAAVAAAAAPTSPVSALAPAAAPADKADVHDGGTDAAFVF